MNKKGFANIILVVVIVILVGAVGYFALVRKSAPIVQQPTPTLTPTQTKTPVSSQTPTPKDETINWKTYRNEIYGYEFRYPSEYQVVDTKGTEYEKNKSVRIISPQKYYDDFRNIYISYDITILATTFSPTIESLKQQHGGNTWTTEKVFSINGLKALLLGGFNGADERVYIFANKETYELINWRPSIEDHAKVFQGVYTSFKVIK